MKELISLSEGGGGEESAKLIQEFATILDLHQSDEDAGIIECTTKQAMSMDSFTVMPLFFAGGDIGKLSVCGSLNDVAMMGAKPRFLTCSFVIEEGFSRKELHQIVESMAVEIKQADVKIVCGDTKVVERGGVKGLIISTTAIGDIEYHGLSARGLEIGDCIIITGSAGSHGALIFALREEIGLHSTLKSDCAQLYPVVSTLFDDVCIHAMRDATRGGVSAVLNEWARASDVGIVIERDEIVLKPEVQGICELLGLDALNLACEGVALIALPKIDAQKALAILHKNGHTDARMIGDVVESHHGRVVCVRKIGQFMSRQFLEYPSGEFLPRIC